MSLKDNKFDIFLSYYGRSLMQVQRFYQTLVETYNLKVWIDYAQIRAGDFPFAKVRDGIQNSSLFILCLSREYERDENCLIELSLAVETFKKQIFVVFFQRIDFLDVPTVKNILIKSYKYESFNAPIFDKGLWLRAPFINKLKLVLKKTIVSVNDVTIRRAGKDAGIRFKSPGLVRI